MAKQRQVKMEQRGAAAAMQKLETLSDEQLERETKFKSAALTILGARAAERYDAAAARDYFQKAIASARPQERMQIRRMRDASLALAERRPDDLKEAVERLGHEAPSGRQLFLLKLMSYIAPAKSASTLLKVRAVLFVLLIIAVLLGAGLGVVELVALPFGGVGLITGLILGLLVVVAVLAVLSIVGRRRQIRAQSASRGS